jgi:hypothetical protein
MSTFPSRVNLQLPDHWTPEQALAVHELLSTLAESVYTRYESHLRELYTPENPEEERSQLDLFGFDDPDLF